MFPLVPKPDNEALRLLAVAEHDVLNSTFDPYLDCLARVAVYGCRTASSAITFLGEDVQYLKARVGIDATSTSREIAFCSHAIMGSGVFIVIDTHDDARFNGHPSVTGGPQIRFYAGMPIRDAAGFALGTICVFDRVPRNVTDEQQHCLRQIAKRVMAYLDSRRNFRESRTR